MKACLIAMVFALLGCAGCSWVFSPPLVEVEILSTYEEVRGGGSDHTTVVLCPNGTRRLLAGKLGLPGARLKTKLYTCAER